MTTLDDLERVERELRNPATVFLDADVAPRVCRAWAETIAAFVREQRKREWQPIETAPKDGTVVLFHVPSERLPSMSRADDLLAKPYWLRGATHWMPLPSPPNPKAKGFKEPTP